ncbi:MAG: hypothetical protein HYT71_01345 [Candidatus Aenigmarchaeota archaeon]|nr:hypothetical protein [Candidatus Aenigmarchaeota archaeon]
MVSDIFTPLVGNLNNLGFYKFVLPWLFTLAVVYGVLLKVKVFGTDQQKSLTAVIAIVAAFFVVNYTPAGFALDGFFTQVFGVGILILTGIFVVLLVMGLVGLKGEDIFKAENLKTGGGMAVVLLVAFIIFLFFTIGGIHIASDQLSLIAVMIFMIVALVFIAK